MKEANNLFVKIKMEILPNMRNVHVTHAYDFLGAWKTNSSL